MTEVLEIEKAIEKLDARELAELSGWWEDFLARKAAGEHRGEAGREGFKHTWGCMAGEEGEEFEKAVAEAGRGMTDTHEW